jgi:threonine dehydratase
VDDTAITQAVVLLVERAKTIAEPAGAAALAALLCGALALDNADAGPICVIVSGGNVDLNLIDRILQRGLGAAGRHLRLRTKLIDRPGVLHHLSGIFTEHAVNVVDVVHHRLGPNLAINEVELEVMLEVRDHEHSATLLQALRDEGYEPIVGA